MIKLVSISGISKQGTRPNNEDYILYNPNGRIIILCDGMGGHGHGEIASKTVADVVFNYLKSLDRNLYEAQDLQDALDVALSTLTAIDKYDDPKPMGTTLVVAVINKDEILVGHVGDSRCYLFDEDGLIKFRTKDHSKVAEAVESEILTEEEAFSSPYKNVLTRCVISGSKNVKIDVDVLTIKDCDRLLLCSDGVNDAMRDKEIEECMINRNIQGSLAIIDSICSEKSRDNYSVILTDLSMEKSVDIGQKIVDDIPINDNQIREKQKKCFSCGAENNINASFCCKCGVKFVTDKVEMSNPPFDTNLKIGLWSRFKKIIPPLLYVFLGALLMVGYYKITNSAEKKKSISDLATEQARNIYNKKQFDKFILKICDIDSKGINKDSVLRKDSIMLLYKNFCKEHFFDSQ